MTIHDELAAINAGFSEAFASQDAARLAAFYADDARLLFHGQPVIRGRADVDAALREMVSHGPATMEFVTDEVISDGSLVVDVGRIFGAAGQSKYVIVYQRQADGLLKAVVDAVSGDSPQPVPR